MPNALQTPALFPLDQIEGVIERITFHAEETGYTVARLNVPGKRDLVTVVGGMGNPVAGESVRLWGKWTTHREFGKQFQVERYETVRPATAAAIEKYLGSGLIKGIGPAMAKRIVAVFGEQTLDVIEEEPNELLKVSGIGQKRVDRIRMAWDEQQAIRQVMLFLQGHGVSATYAVKIYKQYGNDAIRIVEEDPYRLAKDIWGIGFKTADKIAQNLGFAPESEPRLRAGLLYTLSEATDDGHLFLPEPVLYEKAAEILGVDGGLLPVVLGKMVEGTEVVREEGIGYSVLGIEPEATGPGVRRDAGATAGTRRDAGGTAGIRRDAGGTAGIRRDAGGTAGIRRDAGATSEYPIPYTQYPAIYHPALYGTEVGLANRVRKLAESRADERVQESKVESWLAYQAGAAGIELSEEQKQAVYLALSSRFLVLTGGPGTGKTTVTNLICKAFDARHKRMLLASPTGRAAKRLSEVTGREAQTVHRLLKFNPGTHGFEHNEHNPLDCDVLVADEVSMLDAVMAHTLLKAAPEHAQVVFVGDADQLPSVGAGNVLNDLIESGSVTVCRLTQVFRQAAQSLIVTNAHRVNHGEWPYLFPPREREGKDCLFVEVEDSEAAAEMVITVATKSMARLGFSPAEVQVLSPMHRGSAGVGFLNERLQDAWNPLQGGKIELLRGSRRFRECDRVIQLKNNYDKQVYNGDIGVITKIDHVEQELKVAFPEAEVTYDFADYDELQLAYALSIHKSQGSEYPAVILVLTASHYMMLQRNLLYTALTRARKLCVLVGEKRAIGRAVKNGNAGKRFTRLAERLRSS